MSPTKSPGRSDALFEEIHPMTPATDALDAAGILYDTLSYTLDATDEGYGLAAAAALGLDSDTVGKTLIADVGGSLAVAVVPVSRHLDLKKLARAVGAKRATMATPADAERVSGSKVGAISPIGLRQRLLVVIDEALLDHDTVHVSGGRRGLELSLAPDALVQVCMAIVAPLT